jgi:hypothetical protein
MKGFDDVASLIPIVIDQFKGLYVHISKFSCSVISQQISKLIGGTQFLPKTHSSHMCSNQLVSRIYALLQISGLEIIP